MTQRLNDMAWFIWVGWAYLPAAQTIAVGIAILKDQRADPVFPRWLGYFSLWCSIFYLPGGLAVFVDLRPVGVERIDRLVVPGGRLLHVGRSR